MHSLFEDLKSSLASIWSYHHCLNAVQPVLHKLSGSKWKITAFLGMLLIVPFTATVHVWAIFPCLIRSMYIPSGFGATRRGFDQGSICIQASMTLNNQKVASPEFRRDKGVHQNATWLG